MSAVQGTLDDLETSTIVERSSPVKRSYSSDPGSPVDMSRPAEPSPPPQRKKTKLQVPLLQSILTQLPVPPSSIPEPEEETKMESDIWRLFSERACVLPGIGNQNQQLANLLSAAAKLKQVADKAMRK